MTQDELEKCINHERNCGTCQELEKQIIKQQVIISDQDMRIQKLEDELRIANAFMEKYKPMLDALQNEITQLKEDNELLFRQKNL